MNGLISVICTVKNGQNTISKTIESVVKQNYDNWEMIIVDDGSTDATEDVLREYELNNKKIKVYFSGGIGRSKALNTAIRLSNGEYIANIDADDLMHPKKLTIQANLIRKNPTLFLISTGYKIIYNDEEPCWDDFETDYNNIDYISRNILLRNKISHPSVLINKDELIKIGGYNENKSTQVDYELWLRAFMNGKEMGVIPLELVAKRIHKNQSYENKKRIKYTFNSCTLQVKYILKSNENYFFIPISILIFFLSLLPFRVRRFVNKTVFRK